MWGGCTRAPRTADEDISEAAGRVAKELTGFKVEVGSEVMTIKHGVTRYAITLVCVEATRAGGQDSAPGATPRRGTGEHARQS